MAGLIASAAVLFAELGVGKALTGVALKEGVDRLKKASSATSPYRERLFNVVQQLLDEYRAKHPELLPGGKFYFWQSRWALEWAMSYRFYSTTQALLVADIPADLVYMLPPTQEELDEFSTRVGELLDADDKLRKLYTTENISVEQFRANARAEEQRDTTNELLTTITQKLVNQSVEPDTSTQANRVRSAFDEVSLSLLGADHDIPNLGIHLDREETQRLLQWVNSPLQQREVPLAVLEGGAGLGKTVIMQDVLTSLQAQGAVALALKADRLAEPTYAQLAQRILRSTGADELGEALQMAREPDNKLVVVLVDQLDALSQSLSANREALGSYRELIQLLMRQPNVRVVISCRTFDLETDPLLQTYTGKTRFEVQPLRPDQVDAAVAVSAFAGQSLSPTLRALLTVPLHLRIFCQLSGATELGSLTTLQALYDELYTQKVLRPVVLNGTESPAPNPDKLRTLLAEVATAMYRSQRLTAPALRYTRVYQHELAYALSQNLLREVASGKQLQFFHQSFFDYLFARDFVESGRELADLLAEGHQGLFIRSAVNQVLQYLRTFDDREYLRNVRELLLNPAKYRLHIRLLVMQQLGTIADPNAAEQQFVKQHLLSTAENKGLFIESVRSHGWARWLVNQGTVLSIVQQPDDITSSEQNLLWYLARYQPALALEVLARTAADEHSGPRASWVLSLASETTEAGFESVFERFATHIEEADTWKYWNILGDRAAFAPEATADRLFEALKDETWLTYGDEGKSRRNFDSWQAEQAVEKLLKAVPSVGFGLLKRLLEHWIENKRVDRLHEAGYEVEINSIISDNEFSMHEPGGGHAHGLTRKLYDLAQQHLESVAREDSEQASQLLDEWPRSPMRSLLQLTCATYLANPSAFTADIFKLLARPKLLEDVDDGGRLNYYLRELLSQSYSNFTSEQKEELNTLIHKTELVLDWVKRNEPIERGPKHVSRHIFIANGKLTYGYLAALPNVETSPYADVKRRYQELSRRFGLIQNKAPQGMRVRAGHPSPLKSSQAKLLQPTEWLGAFREHQRPTGEYSSDDYGPGLARHFGAEVKAEPAKMLPVLELLLSVENQDIPSRHLREGLSGLAELPDVDRTRLTDLVLRGIDNKQISLNDNEGLRLLAKCVIDGDADGRVVELLAQATIAHRHDERAVTGSGVDELMDGINTTGGHAVGGLLHCYRMTDHTGLIIETLQQVAADGSASVRAAALWQLILLRNLCDPATQPVIDMFLALVGTDYRLLRHANETMRGLIHPHLAELRPLFTDALAEPACHEQVAKTLTLAWAWDLPTAYEQLQPYWEHSAKAREATLRMLMSDYAQLSAAQKLKAQQAFQELLAYDEKELAQAYDFAFHWLTAADFSAWLPLIRLYIQAPVGSGRGRVFYDFLQLCVQDYPAECIELAGAFDNHALPDMQHNALDKKPLDLLLSAYHVLTEMDPDSPQLETAMETFDRMLQLPSYRSGATEALALVDRG